MMHQLGREIEVMTVLINELEKEVYTPSGQTGAVDAIDDLLDAPYKMDRSSLDSDSHYARLL